MRSARSSSDEMNSDLVRFYLEEITERSAGSITAELEKKAAQMEHVDEDVAMQRAQRVELLQSEIMDAYNASLIGKTMEVLVDGYDEEYEQFYGRTYADSPEIDGRVWIASEEPLREGDFVMVRMDGCVDGDLTGYAVEEDA